MWKTGKESCKYVQVTMQLGIVKTQTAMQKNRYPMSMAVYPVYALGSRTSVYR